MKKEIEISAPDGYSFKEVRDGKAVFEKESLPTSWKEYCKNYPITEEECFVDEISDIIHIDEDQIRDSARDANVIKSTETAKAFLALNKLIHLRDAYRQGWVPDWRDVKEKKYNIGIFLDRADKDCTYYYYQQRVLSFQTMELRDKFLENFKDLIEQAKELL